MHYLEITHPQIESIQSQFPLFDSDEVIYYAVIHIQDDSFDHEFGTEKIFTPVINSLEILIKGDWFTLIENELPAKRALFELTAEQYQEIIKHERSRNF